MSIIAAELTLIDENTALLDQADQATEIARAAFDAGDVVTGIAAIQLAAQIIQLARLAQINAALKDAPQ